MDIIFLILAIVGITFAFETPRKYLTSLFRKTQEITHKFEIRASFHTHNNGKKLEPFGSNTTQKKYFFDWVITNHTDQSIQIETGILLKRATLEGKDLFLRPAEFNAEQTILPKHSIKILSIELTHAEIDHYRHWAREAEAFGLKTTSGVEYLVEDADFSAFRDHLQMIALEYGLDENLPEGQTIVVNVNKTQK